MQIRFLLLLFITGSLSIGCRAQDSVRVVKERDNTITYGRYTATKNKLNKNLFWGNATNLGVECGLAGKKQSRSIAGSLTGIEAGRAFVSNYEYSYYTRTYGIGCSQFNPGSSLYFKGFAELTAGLESEKIGIGIGIRADVITDERLFNTYFRAAIGLEMPCLQLMHFDMQYAHSFLLAGNSNPFSNCFVVRGRIFLNRKKWETSWHTHRHRH